MPYYNPYSYLPQAQPQQNVNSGLIWVQGEAGAKSYMVAPNSTVMLMDSESQRFYLKSTDASGMPQPLRIFEYTEMAFKAPQSGLNSQAIDLSTLVTKAEFGAFKDEINAILKNASKKVTKNAESSVSGIECAPEG